MLNISDHIRKGKVQRVSDWHIDTVLALGFTWLYQTPVKTPRQKQGANRELRTVNEWVNVFVRS
jgi:hypothetical protein